MNNDQPELPGRQKPSRFLWPQLAPYRYPPAGATRRPAAPDEASPPDAAAGEATDRAKEACAPGPTA